MMFPTTALDNFIPAQWSTKNYENNGHSLVTITKSSTEYCTYSSKVGGNFNGGIKKIERVQNPFLYGQFLLKQEEYKSRNRKFKIVELFHDTATKHVKSIITNNFDWRLTKRAKFGCGVSFSPSPSYANRQSSFLNGANRAMIVADVIVGKKDIGVEKQTLPRNGSDTTTGNGKNVYVKYFDNEFYPKYVVYYTSVPRDRQVQKPKWYTHKHDDDDFGYDDNDDFGYDDNDDFGYDDYDDFSYDYEL